MFQDVRSSLLEARDIQMHLKPIRSLLDDIEQTDLSEMEPKLSALYHLICLIWSSSKYYRRPSRIVVLLQEIANFIIELIKTFLDPDSILKAEVDEANDQVSLCLVFRPEVGRKWTGSGPEVDRKWTGSGSGV